MKTLINNIHALPGKTIEAVSYYSLGGLGLSFTDGTFMLLEVERGYQDETRIVTADKYDLDRCQRADVQSLGIATEEEVMAAVEAARAAFLEARRRAELEQLALLKRKYENDTKMSEM